MTVKVVRAISTPGLYGDGNTLFLRVAPGGSKQWVQRLSIRGKRHDIGLGGCGWVTLEEARRAAYENRRIARQGGDPLTAKRQAKVPTFREAARRTYEAIDGALPRMPAVKAHLRALPHREVASALDTVADSRASLTAKLALRFLVLTAARTVEVRGATWDEIDIDARVWRIPGERMKAGQEHRVPLSTAALATLQQARALDDGSGLVFPSPVRRGCQMSNMTLTKVLRDTGLAERATVHGFRSSFRDWCAETGKAREVAEAALAHTVGGVEGAYFRSDLFERRRRLMDAWAAYVTGEDATVVALHR